MWSNGKGEVLLNAGDNLSRMCHSREQKNTIATGGQENNVKLYDLEKQQITFSAKNLPHDWLNLRRSISISDLTFLPGSQQLVSVGRYGNVRNTISFFLLKLISCTTIVMMIHLTL